LSALYKALGEALEKQKTKTMSKSGTLRRHANTVRDI
jgi:hypothetical protein